MKKQDTLNIILTDITNGTHEKRVFKDELNEKLMKLTNKVPPKKEKPVFGSVTYK